MGCISDTAGWTQGEDLELSAEIGIFVERCRKIDICLISVDKIKK
ncbi:hypothetical protein [Metabacillus sp. 84]